MLARTLLLLAALLIGACLSACNDMLDIRPPADEVIDAGAE
jgi:predicted small secreted protein